MKVLNDYMCDHCGWCTEEFLDNSINAIECIDCKGVARKVRTIPNFTLPGNDPAGFPTAYDQWEKKREQKMAIERKSENA